MNARSAAVRALVAVIDQRRSLSAAMEHPKGALAASERPLFQELCYGVMRHYWSLAAIADELLDKPLAGRHADLRAALLVGLYQMRHTRIPEHAALMETVALADEFGKGWGKGLLNATLRRYQRERVVVDAAAEGSEEARAEHPAWLIERIRESWPVEADALFAANNEAPPLVLRVNRLRTSRDDYLSHLANGGIDARPTALSPWGVHLTAARDVESIPGFEEGLVSVQDEAAQLAAALLDLDPGQRLLDACAAPGGKCTHALEIEPALAELTALDVDAARLSMVADNLERLGMSARLVTGDAATTSAWWDGVPYDRILLDAPCSGTGVIRRNPDIKLLRKEGDIAKLASQQGRLLDALWPLLKRGGLLLYATCSILPEENWLVISQFIERTPDAVAAAITESWGEEAPVGRQLLPGSLGHDGFYYARLAKR